MGNPWTPGPWEAKVDAHGEELRVTAGEELVVGGCGCCGSPYMGKNHEADARLIAAAPEMAGMLLRCLDYLISAEQLEDDICAILARIKGDAK